MGHQLRSRDKVQPKITESFKEVKPVKMSKRKQEKDLLDENVNGDVHRISSQVPNIISKSEDSELIRAKKALHTSTPVSLPCRESQIEELYRFIGQNLLTGSAGSIYISGAPGTGKTAVVQHVMTRMSNPDISDEYYEALKQVKFVYIFVNCMNFQSSGSIFEFIYKQLQIKSSTGNVFERISNRIVSKTGRPIVIVLDEMDQLLSRSNDILYKIFEWARLPHSKLTLIGIANSLDLTVRHLPLLSASPKSVSPKPRTPAGAKTSKLKQVVNSPKSCRLMQFPPYERADIELILESRINEVANEVFEANAIKFVAAKVAASTGDMRKALNACQIALDTSEKSQRPILKATADDGFNSSSPKKMCVREEKIGITTMSKVLAPRKDEGVLPLQQKILLATLLKLSKEAPNSVSIPNDGVKSAIPLSGFYDAYRKVCTDKGFSWIDRSELTSILSLLEDRSLVHVFESPTGTLKKSKSSKSKGGIFFQPQAVLKILGSDPVVASIVG